MTDEHTEPARLPNRPTDGHKGTFGTVAIVGGCAHTQSGRTMLGGPVLSALASLRAGAGLGALALPDTLLNDALASALVLTGVALPTDATGDLIAHECAPRLDTLAQRADAIVVGPGLGESPGAQACVLRLIGGGQERTPVVLDADGLNNLASLTDYPSELRAPCVLTPHVGEFRTLASAAGVDADPIRDQRGAAEALARRLGVVVALKSSDTVVTDGVRTWLHTGGNPALATGGSGDVLAGVIASLIAQHHRDPILAGSRTVSSEQQGGISLFDAACLGVWAHALAASDWQAAHSGATGGMLASDLLERLPVALHAMRAMRASET